ncbi:MAG: OB-fold nucleic acid binding domain-containing protein, partial [Pseudomonadota bacterium]
LLDQIRLRNSPKGRIAFLTLDDNTGRIDIAVFAQDYAKFDNLLIKDAILIIKGSLGWDEYTGRVRVRTDHVWSFDEYLKQFGALLNIQIKSEGDSLAWVQDLQQLLLPFKDGSCSVMVEYQNNALETKLKFPKDWNVQLDEQLLQRLSKVSEVTNTSIVYKKQSINA